MPQFIIMRMIKSFIVRITDQDFYETLISRSETTLELILPTALYKFAMSTTAGIFRLS